MNLEKKAEEYFHSSKSFFLEFLEKQEISFLKLAINDINLARAMIKRNLEDMNSKENINYERLSAIQLVYDSRFALQAKIYHHKTGKYPKGSEVFINTYRGSAISELTTKQRYQHN